MASSMGFSPTHMDDIVCLQGSFGLGCDCFPHTFLSLRHPIFIPFCLLAAFYLGYSDR